MQNQMEPTVSNRLSRNNYRTTARAVGVVFLAGMAVYILGNAVLVEPHSRRTGSPFRGCGEQPAAGHRRHADVDGRRRRHPARDLDAARC